MTVRPPCSGPLPLRWALILLAAVVAAALTGALTFAETASWPAALLTAAGVAGATIPAGHRVLAAR
jgi:hypothetical protein